jgi:hypothetical protein
MKRRITNKFKRERDNDLGAITDKVTTKMDGNPNFPDPPEALATAKKELPVFRESITKASGGDEEMRFIRKDKRAVLIGLLSELAEYVTGKANGDPAVLVSSGFELNKEKGEKVLPGIKELKVTIDRNGEAVTQVKRVAGAKAYIHQYTPDPISGDSVWTNKCTTVNSYTFTGLTSKERYWFQVIAIGTNGQEVVSPFVSRVIQ